jgi:prepilin-type N-terminal cleavage/methylation domain-containing protein
MKTSHWPCRSSEAGYSLVELLTVVAIIGVLALVTVPSFITYYNSNKSKAAMRTFTSDLRGARATSIQRSHEVKLSFVTGTGKRTYTIYEADRAFDVAGYTTVWTPLTGPGSNPYRPPKTLDPSVYFPADSPSTPQNFTDTDPTPDGDLDVIFFPDGHCQIPAGGVSATITLKTDMNIPKPQYAIVISPSGRVQAQ